VTCDASADADVNESVKSAPVRDLTADCTKAETLSDASMHNKLTVSICALWHYYLSVDTIQLSNTEQIKSGIFDYAVCVLCK